MKKIASSHVYHENMLTLWWKIVYLLRERFFNLNAYHFMRMWREREREQAFTVFIYNRIRNHRPSIPLHLLRLFLLIYSTLCTVHMHSVHCTHNTVSIMFVFCFHIVIASSESTIFDFWIFSFFIMLKNAFIF